MIGKVVAFDGTTMLISAQYDNTLEYIRKNITECEIRLDDGRRISADQRKKIYALFRDISLWSGHEPDEVKALMKYEYIARTGAKYFSLSDTDMTTAREFLEFLIEFCISENVPTKDSLLSVTPDISRYLYCCLLHKKCCISGKKAELHHVDAVGMGRNRKDIIHAGYRVMPLNRIYHTEAHTIGQKTFEDKYKVYGIKLTDELCGIWNVKG